MVTFIITVIPHLMEITLVYITSGFFYVIVFLNVQNGVKQFLVHCLQHVALVKVADRSRWQNRKVLSLLKEV